MSCLGSTRAECDEAKNQIQEQDADVENDDKQVRHINIEAGEADKELCNLKHQENRLKVVV